MCKEEKTVFSKEVITPHIPDWAKEFCKKLGIVEADIEILQESDPDQDLQPDYEDEEIIVYEENG